MNQRPHFWFHLFVLCCLSLCSTSVVAAPLGFKNYMSVDGLSDNRVLCALRDSYGFMWLGTANGLNCFDGQHNTVYRNMVGTKSTFDNNTITSLLEQDNNIWFGGSFGLYIHHREDNSFRRFEVSTRYGVLISATVEKMMRTQNGIIWICTHGQGLFLYDTKTGKLTQDSRHNGFLSDMTLGADGLVYIMSLDGHLLLYGQDGNYERQYDIPGFVTDKNKTCIEHVGSRIFIGCDQGFFRLNTEVGIIEPIHTPTGIGFIRALLAQDNNHLLVGTDHGLFSYDLTTNLFTRIDNPAATTGGLSDELINGLLTDNEGTLWVLTDRGGVCYRPATPNSLEIIDVPSRIGITRNFVRAFCQTHDGRLWVGTDDGLYVLDAEGRCTTPPLLPHQIPEVSTLIEDDHDLWIGTQHSGLYIFNYQTGTLRHHTYSDTRPYTIASNEVHSLLRTRSGDIYVGTSWGLRHYDRQLDRFMFFGEISSMTAFTDLTEDTEGNVWAGSDSHGLFVKRRNSSAFINYFNSGNDANSLPSNAITSVEADSLGIIWIATKGGGLCRFLPQEERFERYGTSETLMQTRQINFIQEDREHALWLGTEGCFIRIPPDRKAQTEAIYIASGNQREQKPLNASLMDAQGHIYVGNNSEILTFNPQVINAGAPQVPLYITAISFPYAADADEELNRLGLNHPLYATKAIRLPHTDNSFTLHFASPRFSGRTLIHYEYMLQGFDKTWAHGSSNSEVSYSNVPPGTYEFLLRESGSDNPDTYARLRVTILSPWYSTPWAYLLYIILLALIIFYFYRRANRRFRRRYEARMEEYRLLQEKENFQSKINFFINLVHEIRTPLSLISLPLEQMEEGELSDENRNHVHAIRRNTNYLLGITNQLLDFQKVESGGDIHLNMSKCDVGHLLDDIYRQFKDPMKVQGQSLQLQLPDSTVITSLDRDKISKVMMNLLGNALKYAKSEVIIRLDLEEDTFSISVIDDGPGVPESERERIFDVYYQIAGDATAANLGTGLGLSYAKMLAKAHGGDIHYENAVGGGSVFMLTLPITAVAGETSGSDLPLRVTETNEGAESENIETSRSFRILLVEDNEELLRATGEGLRKWFHVMKAHDGIEALDVLRHHDIDVIVSDVMMPRMDGNELCRQVKSNIDYSHIPVILLTAKTTVEAKLEGMQSGANIYLEKPFSMKQLHLQITSLLQMRQSFYERMRQVDGAQAEISADNEFGMNQQDILFMERLQELVRQNMRDEEFSIDVLAEQMNMSRSSFYRKIKALTDLTPVDYMKNQRLNRAAQLLRQGQRITEVADQVGFTSSSYFAKCFRAKYGVLPKDYLASLKENTP